jgi:esterase/lipase
VSFFSGFCLQGESELFKTYLKKSEYCVSGFSLGAIKAFEYTLNSNSRIDTLQLFSPAFFQDKDLKFKRLQTLNYKKNPQAYQEQFLKNIAYPFATDMKKYFKEDTKEELQKLLEFIWKEEELLELVNKGVEIEVYLGAKDKIIDSKKAYKFFKEFATVYFIKEGGHVYG